MTWLSLAAKSGGLLLVTPLVLRIFTPAEAALWFLFLTFNGIMQIADFGLGPSFIRAISYARAGRKSLHQPDNLLEGPNWNLLGVVYRVLQQSYWKLSLVVSLLALLVGTTALLKPVSELASPEQGWISWAIVGCASLIAFRNSAYSQWLQGLNEVALVRRIETLCSLAAILATATVLWFTRDFIAGITAMAGGWIFSSFVIRSMALRKRPNAQGTAHSGETKEIASFVFPAAWRSGVGVLFSAILLQSLGVLYAQLAPPEQVASYLLAMRIMTAIIQVSMAPFYAHLPVFAGLYGSGEKARLTELVRSAMAKSHCIFACLAIVGGVFVPPLLGYLDSQVSFVDQRVWFLLAIGLFMERFGAMHLQFYSLSNHILWHLLAGVSGSVILILTFILLPNFGQAAIPLAIIVGYACSYSWLSARLSYRHFDISVARFEAKTSLIPAGALLAALCVALVR